MDLVLNRIEAKNSNKKEPIKNNKTNFDTSEINLDTLQAMFIKEKYENLTKNTNFYILENMLHLYILKNFAFQYIVTKIFAHERRIFHIF